MEIRFDPVTNQEIIYPENEEEAQMLQKGGIRCTRRGDYVRPNSLDKLPETLKTMIRQFDTGATRDISDHKYDYEAFESPLVLNRFGAYMHKHRKQANGKLRDGDNWQKGIPNKEYVKSLFRHFFDVWAIMRGYNCVEPLGGKAIDLQDALCAMRFNVNGLLHNLLKAENKVLSNGDLTQAE